MVRAVSEYPMSSFDPAAEPQSHFGFSTVPLGEKQDVTGDAALVCPEFPG